jgi:D-glycero-D-manno-heptose 1,7-bisphosphate phosphatase
MSQVIHRREMTSQGGTLQLAPQAVFFDRDGVLNVDAGFVFRPEDFVWRETAVEAVKWLNSRGVKVFVVTNQSGVARGFYGEEDVRGLHDHMQARLAEAGAHVDAFRYCPHHPQATVAAFRRECACRKPRSGMIDDLLAEWGLDAAQCLLFGDRETDMEAARGAGVGGVLVAHDRPLIEIVQAAVAGFLQ